MAGLSEAYLYLTPYKYLSTGQKFRFELAFAMTREHEKILIDEYSAFLDRDTAKIVSYMFQKFISKSKKRVVIITANDDIEDYILPDTVIRFDDFNRIEIYKKKKDTNSNLFERDFEILKGNYDDLQLLERYHYFGDVKEGTLIRRKAKFYSLYYKKKLMGIAITTSPYTDTVTETDLININDSLRIIYRIILHPKIRGIGGTKLLYNHFLKKEKKLLFIRSAMAVEHPFVSSLGMIENQHVDYENTSGYQNLLKLIDHNSDQKSVFETATNLLGHIMWEEYKGYLNIIGDKSNLTETFFIDVVKNTFNRNKDLQLVLEILKPIVMKEYYYDNRL
ncbi:hypothetical protein ACWOFR_04810 [Carnobacterium gallinarum]|uniref:hypothetical protein n=1 Tax=Carnobacterium gallinarum TaxID=2749 RepID=UPI000B1649F1|nr:hypothetical protein [Carnobacterium gallinarum]